MKQGWAAVCLLAAMLPAAAQDNAGPQAAAASEAARIMSALEVVEAFHLALQENHQLGAVELLAPELIIYEQGYAERSRDEYAGSHLHNDMMFAGATQRKVIRRQAFESGDLAWVITESLTEGSFGEREVALANTETAVLRREGEAWKIAHIHWSAHPRSAQAPAPEAAPPAPPAPEPDAEPAPDAPTVEAPQP